MIGRLARGGLALAVTVVALAMAAPGAHAQTTPAPPPTPTSQLRLTQQTTWVGDGGTFDVGLAVTTPDPAGAQLQLTVYEALSTRSPCPRSGRRRRCRWR